MRELWSEITANAHVALRRVLAGLTLVGCADERRGLWLLQHGTKLYMARVNRLARDLFYQRVVARFGRHPCRALAEPAPIAALVRMALDDEEVPEGVEKAKAEEAKEKIANAAAALVAEKAEMLRRIQRLESTEEDLSDRVSNLETKLQEVMDRLEILRAVVMGGSHAQGT